MKNNFEKIEVIKEVELSNADDSIGREDILSS
jgi:hypothetical protein